MWKPAFLQTITVIYSEIDTSDVTFVVRREGIMSINGC